MRTRYLGDDLATEQLGQELAKATPMGGTWLLRGELGAGKTTWTRGFVVGLGGNGDDVASPTYAVLHRYETPRGKVFHLDLYRLGEAGAWTLGLDEQVSAGDFLVVEWAGTKGPWPTEWVATLDLETHVEGRQAVWTMPDSPSQS
ncbi:MAG: tRNA (adenosine(37)-N6)-threonylcarbamoyltransferase complex ATPase subunit type 1 TsaE [Holophagaceae bacterium]|nr:tRNA (adenosine(37)-N6)-threonylcarbamoyltransferase complex ATPase subunit type 1 TsaE [Holophagaceae bacterium]